MPSQVQKSEMGGQLETVGERAGGLQLGELVVERQRQVAGFDGFDEDGGLDGFDGLDGFVGLVASSGVDRSDKDLGATFFVDLDGSTKEHKENRRIPQDGCSDGHHTKRNNSIQKSETGGQN